MEILKVSTIFHTTLLLKEGEEIEANSIIYLFQRLTKLKIYLLQVTHSVSTLIKTPTLVTEYCAFFPNVTLDCLALDQNRNVACC